MIEVLGVVVSAGVPLVGGLIWLVRLEGRLNTEAALRTSLAEKVNGLEQQILVKLDKIDAKLDQKADK